MTLRVFHRFILSRRTFPFSHFYE